MESGTRIKFNLNPPEQNMESLSRNIILDLLPAYIAGEASEETRALVDEYARSDQQIARLIRAGSLGLTEASEVDAPVHLEMKAIRRIRSSIRRQMAYVFLGTIALLMIPFMAMQFTDEVDWSPADFIIMGVMLFSAGLTYVLISKMRDNLAYRLGVAVAVVTGFILVWGNLAVGLIGSEDNPMNLMYFGVLLIGIIGAILSLFRPRGMMYSLYAAAAAQFLVPFIAMLIKGLQMDPVDMSPGVLGIIILNTVFAVLFLVSATLFRKASEAEKK